MRILIINGPSLNMLGKREPDIYGTMTYQTLETALKDYAKTLKIDVEIHQSNLEGIIIDLLQHAHNSEFDGVILNAAAYTHYAYSLYDAIKSILLPVVEVHLTDPSKREEPFRHHSVIEKACAGTFKGKHIESYFDALHFLNNYLQQ